MRTGGALRALQVVEERELAGRAAGLLYLTAAVTALLLMVVPGVEVESGAALLVVAALGLVWGTICLTVMPWDTAPPLVSHFSSAMGLPLTAIAMAATGGADSPARFYLFFIIFFASYFYPPREAIPHLVGCALVLASPILYQPDALDSGLLAEMVVLIPTFALLSVMIMGGKAIMLDLSRHDPLTGLVNRRVFQERLDDSVGSRAPGTFGVMLCDLDSFKSLNDRFGHPEGDRVLCEVARALHAAVRSDDLVARLGGDEFAVVLEGADAAMMEALEVRLTRELRIRSEHLDLGGFVLSASLGWAIYPADGGDWQELVIRADRAMRRRKSATSARSHLGGLTPSRG